MTGDSLRVAADVRGDLGGHEVVGVLGQDAGDVQGDVADADDGDLLGAQVPGARVVGVTVVPGDEVGAAVALGASTPGMSSGASVSAPVEKTMAS